MENIREKIAEIITHTHKTPLEQADEILLLFGVNDLFCPDCGAETQYYNDLGLYKCNECEWEG